MKRHASMALLTLALTAGQTPSAQSNQTQSNQSQSNQSQKRLIEVGWDAPTPAQLRASIGGLQQTPFAGMMVNLSAGKTIFNKVAYPESAYANDRRDLAATNFGKLTDNFITVWSARESGWDWFSDSDWKSAQTNARNFARTAKAGRFKGFAFDPEPYGTNPWSYSPQLYPKHSFAAVQAKVRQRGAAFMTAVQAEMPSVTILSLFGVSYVRHQAEMAGSLERADWALLASFIDGMLDVIGPQARLIDGNELSYYRTKATDFAAFRAVKQAARDTVSPENRAKYDAQVGIAHAVYVDGLLNLARSPRFFGYYLRDDPQRQQMLEHNVYHGLKASDRYVWVYNEDMDWWGSKGKGVQVPAGLGQLLGRAVQKVNRGQALGFEPAGFIAEADRRFGSKVQLSGRITQGGQGVGGVQIDSGQPVYFGDASCQPSNPDGYFDCTMPPGWSGKLTPSKSGLSFDPPTRTLNQVGKNDGNLNFAASNK